MFNINTFDAYLQYPTISWEEVQLKMSKGRLHSANGLSKPTGSLSGWWATKHGWLAV